MEDTAGEVNLWLTMGYAGFRNGVSILFFFHLFRINKILYIVYDAIVLYMILLNFINVDEIV